jgi:putative transposase
MATRNIVFSKDEYYHIYNRGVEKKILFKDDKDYEYFIRSLYFSLSDEMFKQQQLKELSFSDYPIKKRVVSIGAYVLMPNHFHLLVKVKDKKEFSTFMNKLQTSYAMYFNNKYVRTGRLFQGTFKAKHIDQDEYLKYLYGYIHLNPIKKINPVWKSDKKINISKTLAYLQDFKYSSYLDYIAPDGREESKILDMNAFPSYFKSKQAFQKMIDFWIKYRSTFLQGNPVKK